MKLNLIESIGCYGIFTEIKTLIKERNEIEIDRDGTLVLTAIMPHGASVVRSFKSKDRSVVLNDVDVMQGTVHVDFVDERGCTFRCGEFHRNGRFVQCKSNSDEILVALSSEYVEQKKQITKIESELDTIKNVYGVSLV